MGLFRLVFGLGAPPMQPQMVVVTPQQLAALSPPPGMMPTYRGKRPQLALIDADGNRVPVRAITRVGAEFDEA